MRYASLLHIVVSGWFFSSLKIGWFLVSRRWRVAPGGQALPADGGVISAMAWLACAAPQASKVRYQRTAESRQRSTRTSAPSSCCRRGCPHLGGTTAHPAERAQSQRRPESSAWWCLLV